ncbi:MAG: histidine kinase, partial [Syntrophobacteraceae bacterium]
MNSTRFPRPYALFVTAAWVTIIIGLMLINLRQIRAAQYAMATIDARANVDEDIAFRLWVSSKGGVYVPVSDGIQPDSGPSRISEHDILTPTGKVLTLIDATTMLRRIKLDYPDLYGIRGHLTGLSPLQGETAPDEWEKAALLRFREGIQEISEVVSIDGVPYLRLIKPVCGDGHCLKYTANSSTEAAEGGESIAVPLSPYLARMQKEMIFCVACYGIVLAIGLTGIGLGRNR